MSTSVILRCPPGCWPLGGAAHATVVIANATTIAVNAFA
jgi:hypothetical protein